MIPLLQKLKTPFYPADRPGAYLQRKDRRAFIAVILQLILLTAFSFLFRINEKQGFPLLMAITLPAFLLHSFLPLKWRPVFLLAIFGCTVIWSLEWVTGSFVIFVSLCIFAVTELPVRFFYRILLIALITGGLIFLHSQRFFAPRAIIAVPYIAAIFMFRLISYLYYRNKIVRPEALSLRLNYFLLLPNLVFLLFPIIDYKTYTASYYSQPAIAIYRKGIYRLVSGTLLLMIHRLLYYYCAVSPNDIHDLSGLVYYNFISYLLIIQIVAFFQLCVGWVTLFGHDLPSIFENFFLAKGFSDLWRKINHYWRDFMVKTFYFPLFFRLRKAGQYPAMIIAGLTAFFCSWMMHSEQMYWITGQFPFSANDAIYWMTMGIFITADGIYEYRTSGRIKVNRGAGVSILANGLRIAGIFIFSGTLWSLWNSPTVSGWWFVMQQGQKTSPGALLTLGGWVVLFILLTGTYNYFFKKIPVAKTAHTRYFILPWFFNAVLFLFVIFRVVTYPLPPGSRYAEFADQIDRARVNNADREIVDLGYYDKLADRGGISRTGAQFRLFGDLDWGTLNGASHRTGDILLRVFNPNADVMHNGYRLRINHMGLRDREYTDIPAPGVTRWAFLGSSYILGPGVEEEQTFQAIVERDLNDSLRKAGKGGLDILDYGNGGYLLPQAVALCRHHVFQYHPDAVFYFAHPGEYDYTPKNISRLVTFGIDLSEYPTLDSIVIAAGLRQSQSREEMLHRLEPYRERLLRWGYKNICDDCRLHHVRPVWVFLPETTNPGTQKQFSFLSTVARQYGFTVLDLRGVFSGYTPSSIQVGDPDTHPNILGHRLIAHLLEKQIREAQLLNRDSTSAH